MYLDENVFRNNLNVFRKECLSIFDSRLSFTKKICSIESQS